MNEIFPGVAQYNAAPSPQIEIEPEYTDFIPEEFLSDPLGYIEHNSELV